MGWRQAYYWAVAGAIGLCFGQGAVVMWPEWSAWTWWGIGIGLTPFLAVPTIWDRRHSLATWIATHTRHKVGVGDKRAIETHPGNGLGIANLILNAKTTDEAEMLFDNFMPQPHKHREERVFAAYWVQTCKLRGVNEHDCWQEVSIAAVEHGRKTGDSRFWDRTIPEMAEICRRVYGDLSTGSEEDQG